MLILEYTVRTIYSHSQRYEPHLVLLRSGDALSGWNGWGYQSSVSSLPSFPIHRLLSTNETSSGQTVADYATAAGKTSSSKAPANIQGGVFAAASQPSGSPSASGSSSATAAPKPTNNGAGRELGVGFAAVMGAGLLVGAFLLG